MASGFLVGAALEKFLSFSSEFIFLSLGFVAGVLVYIVGREVLPVERKGNPFMFILGVVLYSILLIYLKIFSFI